MLKQNLMSIEKINTKLNWNNFH